MSYTSFELLLDLTVKRITICYVINKMNLNLTHQQKFSLSLSLSLSLQVKVTYSKHTFIFDR